METKVRQRITKPTEASLLERLFSSSRQWSSHARGTSDEPYKLSSLVYFVVGLGVLVLLNWSAGKLATFGLAGNLINIVLLPLGSAVVGYLLTRIW